MKLLYALSFVLFASSAMAQAPQPAPPPAYIPIVIEQSDLQAITQWLGEQPMKFAAPVQNWLNSLEQRALDKAKPPAAPAATPAPATPTNQK